MYVVICRSQSFYEHVGMYVRMYVHHNIFPGEYLINLFIKKWNLLFPYELPVVTVQFKENGTLRTVVMFTIRQGIYYRYRTVPQYGIICSDIPT